ncbi:hypothetical protein [Amycolatopsis sp. WGS_07]
MRKAMLTLVYVLFVVPAGLVIRVLRDPMRRSWKRGSDSYWQRSDS